MDALKGLFLTKEHDSPKTVSATAKQNVASGGGKNSGKKRTAASTKTLYGQLPASSWLSALQLSQWDNIAGPRIDCLWDGVERITDELQSYASRHTLVSGDSPPPPAVPHVAPPSGPIDTKFHVFSDLGFMIVACVFDALPLSDAAAAGPCPPVQQPVRHSLALVVRTEHLARYLHLHSVVDDRLRQLVELHRALISQCVRDEALAALSAAVGSVLVSLEALFVSRWLPPLLSPTGPSGHPLVSPSSSQAASSAGSSNSSLHAVSPPPPPYYSPPPHAQSSAPPPPLFTAAVVSGGSAAFGGTMFAAANGPLVDMEFVARVVTSHLATHGYTVVSATCEQHVPWVNMYVDSLALLDVCPGGRQRSARVAAGQRPGYVPDLVLQGVVLPAGSAGLTDAELITARQPCTIVDVSAHDVRQTLPCHEFAVLRADYLQAQREWRCAGRARPGHWAGADSLQRPVKSAAPCVERLLQELVRLPDVLREACLQQFMCRLTRRAVLLIKFVAAEQRQASRRAASLAPGSGVLHADSPALSAPTASAVSAAGGGRPGGGGTQPPPPTAATSAATTTTLEAAAVRRLRTALELVDSEADFQLVIGVAEALAPGVLLALAGNPHDIELKFLELFESF
eukprot:TRINITY_DN7074_c0_g1_i2.p1 TRINITY_DN7074_c0_g1~~TRINITY_DN7074_c0_g1_i2.p1  ORF type:complete len:627 (-),score=237.14 TRINITY_DN7074_c0_g1_i2:161-2041(-)